MDGQAPRLTLHVPPKDRHDPGAGVVVQGSLFDASGLRHETETRGYRGTVASRVAGITYRQLDYWARKQIVEPSINPSHGSGSRRLYSFKDVVILAVSKRLLDAGVNLHNVTVALGVLMRHTAGELEDITIMCDGETVYECTTDEEVIALVRGGRAVFGVSVGALWHHVRSALSQEEFVDLTARNVAGRDQDHQNQGSQNHGQRNQRDRGDRPLDEITARRRLLQAEQRSREQRRAVRGI
ncbi:MerR family transcriptional regulator [Bifidobacterium simiarum]|uniref:Transcriptional regulator n=1 Tax=Bifidobacterium simiarum TaxID=2045441 RepID=A0A2M9HDB7_9BIFI|nr:MerR family transcriptional regulator [Bifidobacterium simiarum]PJM74809.1 transcriptional regulator [Bifidobacterium simiarum]